MTGTGLHQRDDKNPLMSDGEHEQSAVEEITAGPQANFTLLDQMSEIRKKQSTLVDIEVDQIKETRRV
jgi:hypothetical protein